MPNLPENLKPGDRFNPWDHKPYDGEEEVVESAFDADNVWYWIYREGKDPYLFSDSILKRPGDGISVERVMFSHFNQVSIASLVEKGAVFTRKVHPNAISHYASWRKSSNALWEKSRVR